MSKAVIGLGCGDEGKGMVVSSLCSQFRNPLVIRYSGGHQAAHHVVMDGNHDHVFANFGSGTLQGFDTYWSEYCTFDPMGVIKELATLKRMGMSPKLYVNANCPVTTPYEKCHNRQLDKRDGHGTCGVGVGQTHQREADHYSLLVRDLLNPTVLKIKLSMLGQYYPNYDLGEELQVFLMYCNELINLIGKNIYIRKTLNISYLERHDEYIFEGSQGMLLDQNIGFFPHVTRSSTGTKNILSMGFRPDVYLVTRAYQTRHGNGPMTNEELYPIPHNPNELNLDTGIQGKFRTSILDLDLLKYALQSDEYISYNTHHKHLVITCMDIIDRYAFTIDGTLFEFPTEEEFVSKICEHLSIRSCFISRDPEIKTLEKFSVNNDD